MGRANNTSPVTRTPPMWVGEFLAPDKLMPAGGKLLLSAFFGPDSVLVTAGATAAGAVSLVVTALVAPAGWDGSSTIIPNGTVLHFGTNKFAVVNDANVQPGDVAITVLAIPTALAGGETARYPGTQIKSIPSGTVVGRTYAERATGDRFAPAAAGDDEVYILAFDITDLAEWDGDADFVKPKTGVVVKENYLPGWSGLAAAVQALVRAAYNTQIGVA